MGKKCLTFKNMPQENLVKIHPEWVYSFSNDYTRQSKFIYASFASVQKERVLLNIDILIK